MLRVAVAAIANLLGAFFTVAVAKTIAKGIIDGHLATMQTLLAALIGAIAWNLVTWRLGLPSSSSHALIGGLVGAALAQSGTSGVQWHGLVHKVSFPRWSRPRSRSLPPSRCCWLIYWVFRSIRPSVANRGFRLGQLATGTWVAFVHGSNDAQKTMGVIALALVLHDHGSVAALTVPTWVKIAAGVAIALGTYVGGWRIMRTLGQGIFKLEPESGFAAQAATGATIYAATKYGYPLSTTHVVSGAITGAGATTRLSAVRWGIAGRIAFAWMLTLPASAATAALLYWPIYAIT